MLVTHALNSLILLSGIRGGEWQEAYKEPNANIKQSAIRFLSVRFNPFNSLIGSSIITMS
jgi:hypothetical protein